ncbi:hypothetical protein ACEN8K_43105, partial [Variovorax sp. CT11-76]
MHLADYSRLDATALADAIRRKETTAAERTLRLVRERRVEQLDDGVELRIQRGRGLARAALRLG